MTWNNILSEKPKHYNIEKFFGTYDDAVKRKKKLEKQFPNKKIELRIPVIGATDNEYNIVIK